MLIHPLVKTLVTRPELLAEHAGAYAELAGAELGEAAGRLRRRALLLLAAGACALVGLLLAGGAGLLAAAIPMHAMPAPWALVALPLALLGVAGLLWWLEARAADIGAFDALRAQIELDRELLRAAGQG